MDVLIVRHAEAVPASKKLADEDRPLTKQGRRQLKRAALRVALLVDQLGLIAASPLVRAIESAELLAKAYDMQVTQRPELAPGHDVAETAEWLRSVRRRKHVALVGHEPHLSTLATHLLTGHTDPILSLDKGACCLIRFEKDPTPGRGQLLWLLPPAALDRMKRR